MGAAPRGNPGWPLLAFWMASTDKKRMVLTQRSSNESEEGWIEEFLLTGPSFFRLDTSLNPCKGWEAHLTAFSMQRQGLPHSCRKKSKRQVGVLGNLYSGTF
jgi:hypothetical protein